MFGGSRSSPCGRRRQSRKGGRRPCPGAPGTASRSGPSPAAGAAAIAAILASVAPIFGIILLGWLAARLRAFDEAATRGLSLFAFNVAIPVMLLRTLAQADLPPRPEWALVLTYFACTGINFAVAALLARGLLGRRGAEPALFGIAGAFSNVAVLGVPVILQTYGPDAAVPLSLLLAFHSATIFTLTTIVAEIGLGGQLAPTVLLRNIGRGLVTNPMLWGIAAGVVLGISHLRLPFVLDRMAELLAAASLPAALFALGANLSRFRLLGGLGVATGLALLKLVLQPLLVAAAVHLVGLSPMAQSVAVTVAALPTGINAYLFAVRYQAAVAESSSTILVSTLLSILTLGALMALLRPG